MARESYGVTALVNHYDVALASCVRGRLLEDLVLGQFRATKERRATVFAFCTTTCGGERFAVTALCRVLFSLRCQTPTACGFAISSGTATTCARRCSRSSA